MSKKMLYNLWILTFFAIILVFAYVLVVSMYIERYDMAALAGAGIAVFSVEIHSSRITELKEEINDLNKRILLLEGEKDGSEIRVKNMDEALPHLQDGKKVLIETDEYAAHISLSDDE